MIDRERLERRGLLARKEECPECYERWVKLGVIRPLTEEEVENMNLKKEGTS